MQVPLAVQISASLGALGLMAAGYAYAAMAPGSQIFGRTFIAPRKPGELALTFDDGPNPVWTPRLLNILGDHQAHATFFLIGRFAQAEPALVRRIHAEGHLIGNHSWLHPNLAVTRIARVRAELTQTRDAIEQITGTAVRWFRPPFGGKRPAVLRIARELGMTPVLWNAMTNDWSDPSADRIANRLSAHIDRHQQRGRATNIVLHDGGHLALDANRGPSVAAAGQLLAKYATTHRFVRLDAWLDA